MNILRCNQYSHLGTASVISRHALESICLIAGDLMGTITPFRATQKTPETWRWSSDRGLKYEKGHGCFI